MCGAIPLFPQYVFMVWCLVKHGDNFTFCLVNLFEEFPSIPLCLYDVILQFHTFFRWLCIFVNPNAYNFVKLPQEMIDKLPNLLIGFRLLSFHWLLQSPSKVEITKDYAWTMRKVLKPISWGTSVKTG